LPHGKKSWNGAMDRRALLAAGGIGIQHDLGDAGMAPIDDVLDACAAALSARRFARGEAVSLPDPPEKIAGRDAAIWF
jgi:predicted RNase H-like nuclease